MNKYEVLEMIDEEHTASYLKHESLTGELGTLVASCSRYQEIKDIEDDEAVVPCIQR